MNTTTYTVLARDGTTILANATLRAAAEALMTHQGRKFEIREDHLGRRLFASGLFRNASDFETLIPTAFRVFADESDDEIYRDVLAHASAWSGTIVRILSNDPLYAPPYLLRVCAEYHHDDCESR